MPIEIKKSGKYTGDGTEQEIKTAESFELVKIRSTDGDYEAVKERDMTETIGKVAIFQNGMYRKINVSSGEGITFIENGFKVGSSSAVNEDGQDYIWEVM